jgi:P-type conjugative transfer protein TrbJ
VNPALPLQKLTLGLPLIAVALASFSVPAAAQLTVFDPVNQQQNLLSATRALQQINNQLRQLQADAQMLSRMDQNLTRLKGSISPDLERTLEAISGQLRQGNAIALGLKDTELNYARLFPRQSSSNLSSDASLRAAEQRWDEEYASLQRAARLQGAIADGLAADGRLLSQAMERSRTANGALEVAQAGNELSGLGIKQTLGLQGLLAAQQRAETLKAARDLANEAEARQRFKSFLGSAASVSAKR